MIVTYPNMIRKIIKKTDNYGTRSLYEQGERIGEKF